MTVNVNAYAQHNYEVIKATCVERHRGQFRGMTKETKITVNGRKIGYYGFNDSADNVITLSITKTDTKLPVLHLSFKNLIKFDSSYSNIEKIDDIGNETFPYLQLFNLSHNAISSVKSYVFSHLKEVEILDLSHNCFVEFHIDIVFLQHEKLKELYLQDNLLHKIHSLLQEPKVMTLNLLDISNNFLETFKNFDLAIKRLEMEDNQLESVEIFYADQMTLNAQNNLMEKFSSTGTFKLLNLSHNVFNYLSDFKFMSAETVDVSYNHIEKWAEIDESTENELSDIQSSENELSNFESSEEELLFNKTSGKLFFSQKSSVGENTSKKMFEGKKPSQENKSKINFDSLRIKVEHLNLAHNNLNTIADLSYYKDCKTLNLQDNKLKNIDLEEFRVMFPLLKRVNLLNNPLTSVDEFDLKFFNTTQFLQLHFEYSLTTPTPTSTFLPLFLPLLYSTVKSTVNTTSDSIDTTEATSASSHSPQTESMAHTTVATTTETNDVDKLEKTSDDYLPRYALLFIAVVIVSMLCLSFRNHKLINRRQRQSFNEVQNYF